MSTARLVTKWVANNRRVLVRFTLLTQLVVLVALSTGIDVFFGQSVAASSESHLLEGANDGVGSMTALGQLPLAFVPNVGQRHAAFPFEAHGMGT